MTNRKFRARSMRKQPTHTHTDPFHSTGMNLAPALSSLANAAAELCSRFKLPEAAELHK